MPNTAHHRLFFLLATCTLLCSPHVVHEPSPALFVTPPATLYTRRNLHHMPSRVLAVVSPPLLSTTNLIACSSASTAISTRCYALSSRHRCQYDASFNRQAPFKGVASEC
ncbi:hypothetical protein BD779DRAFT_1532587 [Infundibulicybe gibba]|nr:hypothetical protein BD779DRAFT_1532587 [Infundibulicybe gibba]